MMSVLLAATIILREASSGEYCFSSALMASKSSTGSRPSEPDTSTTWISSRQRSMAQKVVAQAGTVGGALDDTGDIGHDEGDPLLHINHPQIGEEGGEVVVGDLGMGLADHAQKRGFAHVGEAHQTHIGQQLQLQHHLAALAGVARLGKAGYLPGGGGEVLVAPAAPAALAEDEGGVIRHIADDLLGGGVPDDGAPGHLEEQVLPVPAGAAVAAPGGALPATYFRL